MTRWQVTPRLTGQPGRSILLSDDSEAYKQDREKTRERVYGNGCPPSPAIGIGKLEKSRPARPRCISTLSTRFQPDPDSEKPTAYVRPCPELHWHGTSPLGVSGIHACNGAPPLPQSRRIRIPW